MWTFLSGIRSHPIYQRERGRWGEVNGYYKRITNYLWLMIFAFPVLFFTNFLSPFSILGSEQFGFLFITTCLPNLAVQLITWIGLISAPAMTAPAVVEEVQRGSWDILRLTPMPVHEIVIAKLLGGLSHLKIWIPLLVISLIQIVLLLLGLTASVASSLSLDSVLPFLMGSASLLLRPWLEIIFAGFIGITISLWAATTRGALISSYAIILIVKIFLSNIVALVVGISLSEIGFDLLGAAISVATPILLYTSLIIASIFLIVRRSRYMETI